MIVMIFIFIFLIMFIAMIVGIPIYRAVHARKQRNILGKEKYDELKNNFDARRIMGELNYIISEIEEYWDQIEYLRAKSAKNILRKYFPSQKEMKLDNDIKRELDNYIKKEWNPRIKILSENSINYYSDKELRDAFTQFSDADSEIQKLTIEGAISQEFNKSLKVATIATVAITGLAIGAVGAANRFGDRQSFRDNFGA